MTENQRIWVEARNQLASAVTALGYPEEFADLLAKQIGSPRGIDRITSYLSRVKPRSMEMIVDEMLAIRADIDKWRDKRESEQAQAGITAWLNNPMRWEDDE